MKKSVILIGGRNKAKSLAKSLLKRGYKVTAINESYDDCLMLSNIDGLKVIHGDATKPFILDEADASECDISIALTCYDSVNLVASELCKKRFGVRKTVSLAADPQKIPFFKQMGVDSVVCAISMVTNIIEQQAIIDEMKKVEDAHEGQVHTTEVHVYPSSPITGKQVQEIQLSARTIIGCVLRGENTIIPKGNTRILADDTLILISADGRKEELAQALNGGH